MGIQAAASAVPVRFGRGEAVIVYLSSTLNDLREERQAIRDVLGGECAVRESYVASEQELVASCVEDIANCELYIGVLGLRYGYQPPGGAESVSITEIEYREAGRRGIPRLMFVKEASGIFADQIDEDLGLIKRFRDQVSQEQRPALFKTVADLKLAVQKAWSEYKLRKTGGGGLFKGVQTHPCEIEHELAIGYVPGSDEALREALATLAAGDRRITLFPLTPAEPEQYLARLDRQARRARAVLLPVSAASWPRVKEKGEALPGAIGIAGHRARIFGMAVGLTRADLSAEWNAALADVVEFPATAWDAAQRTASFESLRRWVRERLPEAAQRRQVGLPCMVLAPTAEQAAQLADEVALFDQFGEGAPVRRKAFEQLRQRVQDGGLVWPRDFYARLREDWRPFGPQEPTARAFIDEAARRANAAAEGSRERRHLLDRELVPQWYGFDEFWKDSFGSRANLVSVCENGCLVLLDEFALLHPALREAIGKLLVSDNVAVVALSACDPTHSPLRKLLDDFSHLNLGNLRDRFRNEQDPCCELAVNSIPRLERWLRLVLPELLSTLGRQQSNPNLVQRAAALFAP